jgi:hypothetical protein
VNESVRRTGWRERVAWVVASSGAAWAFTAWVDLRPRPVVLAGVIAAGFAVSWTFTDLVPIVGRIEWAAPWRRIDARHGLDPRFLQTARLLRDDDRADVARRVHRDLIRVIDDRLMAGHGIDRRTDPDRADSVLGPDLVEYVAGPPHPRQLSPRHLDIILTRIEAL